MSANHLVHETSPYLRQHAGNPVEWYPWGATAIERARAEDKPIFVSIGYSACHWCHVMAHESFEDPATAAFLGEHFVSVKVDREERPDLDALYMRAVMLMTGSGGWPLTVFLTPGLRPFYGGTYFPREERWGMPSFRQVLEGVAGAYCERRGEVEESANGLLAAVSESFAGQAGGGPPGPEAAQRALTGILDRFDSHEGGFGGGPKFPQPPLLDFMLDEAARRGDRGLRERVLFTLRKMEAGGIRDQAGGGFHRYSVDGKWHVPHYEKMLYDNAQLASLYFRAFRVSGEEEFRRVAREILADMASSMAAAGGGFVAALDADSEGEEGRFYLWTPRQLEEVLGLDEGRRFAEAFGVSAGGGLEHQTLRRTAPWERLAGSMGLEPEEGRRRLAEDLGMLRGAREARPHPGVDTKVLTDWNALAAAAYLDGALACGDGPFRAKGLETLALLWRRCWDGAVLHHVWDGQRARVPGFLSDHAYLAFAEWRAFEVTGDPSHLKNVEVLLGRILRRFGDASGRFIDAPPSTGPEGPIIAVRDTDDGVLPAPISILARVLWAWERLTDSTEVREALEGLLRAEAGALERAPASQPLLAGLAAARSRRPVEVVVAAATMEEARPLLEAARAHAHPDLLVLPLLSCTFANGAADRFALLRGRASKGHARGYLCVGGACRAPTSEPGVLSSFLAKGLGQEALE